MKYARFHPDYSDVAGYFERVAERLELGSRPDGRRDRIRRHISGSGAAPGNKTGNPHQAQEAATA